jgi:integrase/recombinase XerD
MSTLWLSSHECARARRRRLDSPLFRIWREEPTANNGRDRRVALANAPMPYQFKREPLTQDEANRLANACEIHEQRLVVWTLLDTGLWVPELAGLSKDNLDWQTHRLMIYGKAGPYGTRSKRRIVPLTPRAQALIEGHLALHDQFGISVRTIQRTIKRVANKANISRPVTPHVLRHTFSVTAVLKGISLPSLQRLLGHDRLTTTEIYLNLSPEEAIKEFQSKW